MEITSIQKNLHNTPRKIKLVVDMIKKMKPLTAIGILEFTNKSAALPVSKAIKTVLGNVKSQNLDVNQMIFKSIEVNGATKMKRYRPGTKGRAKQYAKRMTHIKIVLTNDVKVEEKKEATSGKKS